MAMEGSHINKKCVHPRAHIFILLSKMTKFSPKNFTLLLIKLDVVVSATWPL